MYGSIDSAPPDALTTLGGGGSGGDDESDSKDDADDDDITDDPQSWAQERWYLILGVLRCIFHAQSLYSNIHIYIYLSYT